MRKPSTIHRRKYPAPCRGARVLLAIAMGASLVIATGTLAGFLLRPSNAGQNNPSWMRVLSLSAPALAPAGSAVRHPETLSPAIDLRFAAGLEPPP